MTTKTWIATHEIVHGYGSQTVEVMLDATGAAYQRHEWDATVDADYERTGDGRWLFQGEPFVGQVTETDDGRTRRLYLEAESRVHHDDRLSPHAATILEDHGDGDDHWQWVIDADADEILSWAEAHL